MVNILLRIQMVMAALVCITIGLSAQSKPDVPWSYGAHLGLNYNLAGTGYGVWHTDGTWRDYGQFIPYVRNDGSGLGLYGGLNMQYMPLSWLGIQGRLSYDNRSLTAIDDQTYQLPDGSYLSDEFGFHVALVNFELLAKLYLGDRFHLTGGAGLGIKVADNYHVTPDGGAKVEGKTLNGSAFVGSFIGGLGYEIPLSDVNDKTQWTLTPFLEATYMYGMREVDFSIQSGFADGLSIVTLRAGFVVAKGDVVQTGAGPADQSKFFRVSPPEDGLYSKRVVEEFIPLRPFVFFEYSSADIPSRYNNITSADTAKLIDRAKNEFDAATLSDVDARKSIQGEVYYNLVNIVGYRLTQRQEATITLIGSDPKEKNGLELAETIRTYLVNTWGIDNSRITTKGQLEPRVPSGTSRTPVEDRPLADVENRRVELVSNDPWITRRASLKAEVEAREENEVLVEITTNESIQSWQATITGPNFKKSYGPYTDLSRYLDPTGMIAEGQSDAALTIEVIAKTTDGRTLSETEEFEVFKNNKSAQAERFSLVFDYNDADPTGRASEFLNDVAPRIQSGETVYISGFTDNIGADDVNMRLSKDRASQVKRLLEERLKKNGVKAIVRAEGYGEESLYAPFPNSIPEGRMYNRTVIIDIIP